MPLNRAAFGLHAPYVTPQYEPQCAECKRIILRCAQAGASRTLAEQELARYRPTGDSYAFTELWQACEIARKNHDALHMELRRHLEAHNS